MSEIFGVSGVISGDIMDVLRIIPSRWLCTLIKSRVVSDIFINKNESLSYPQHKVISVEKCYISVEYSSRRIASAEKKKITPS